MYVVTDESSLNRAVRTEGLVGVEERGKIAEQIEKALEGGLPEWRIRRQNRTYLCVNDKQERMDRHKVRPRREGDTRGVLRSGNEDSTCTRKGLVSEREEKGVQRQIPF